MRAALLALALILPVPAAAGAGAGVEVVASITPVHSLVARVMQGAGTPRLLLPPGVSPHDHSLRPSDAGALQGAALVVWIGPRLEPWLVRPLDVLAGGARRLRLDAVPGLTLLAARAEAGFAARDHGGEPVDAGGETDPHLWLDPVNAGLWLDAIAGALAEADPDNAARFRANAAAARAELDRISSEIAQRLAPLRGRPFILFHDGLRYFEHRFGIEAAGAVAPSDARPPGPARIAAIRARIRETGAKCLFGEPQFRSRLLQTVAEDTGVRIGVLDPLGAGFEPGPGLYPALLDGIARGLADCLGQGRS